MTSANEQHAMTQPHGEHRAAGGPPALPALPAGHTIGHFVLDLMMAVTVFFLIMIIVGVIAGVQMAMSGKPMSSAQDFVMDPLLMIVAMFASIVLAAMVPYLFRRRASWHEVKQSVAAFGRWSSWVWVVACTVLLLGGSMLLTFLDTTFEIGLEPSNQAPIEQMMASWFGLTVFYAVVIAPVFEEILFRRVLFGRFLAAGRPVLGLILSSAVFASFHEFAGMSGGPWHSTLILWGFYFFMACVFAWAYKRTGSLLVPIAIHMANNAVAMSVLGSS